MKIKHTIALSLVLVFVLLSVSSCGYTSIKDLNEAPEKYLGEEVVVKGTVENTVKIGKFSGFTLRDGNYAIPVSSDTLPKEGEEITIQGTVMKEILIGYYIYAKKVY